MQNNGYKRSILYKSIQAATMATALVPQFTAAAEENSTLALEEIVVTAEFREVSSQDVPIAITAFSGEFIQDNFQGSYELAGQIPNVQIEAPGGFGQPRNSIRGVGQADFNPNAVTPIMVYVDDVALNAAVGQGLPLWDLQRVEVLRGPQGTLYGRNATAGAMRFISVAPSEETEGMLETTVGAYNQLRIDGAIGGAITDNVRGRLAVTVNDRDGYYNNVTRGEDEGAFSYDGYRGIVEWDVTDAFTVTAKAQYFESFQETLQFKSTPGLVAGDAFGPAPDPLVNGWESVAALQAAFGFQNLGPGSNFETTEDAHEAGAELKHEVYSIKADWAFENFTLTSITGNVGVDHDLRLANDSVPAAILDENSWAVSEQYSQEFRLTSTTDGPLQWIAGLYWLQEEMETYLNIDATEWWGNVSYGFPDSNTVMYTRGAKQDLETYAAFLHTTYEFSDALTGTAAVRYTTEDKEIDYVFRSLWDFPTLAGRYDANPDPIQQSRDFVRAVRSGNLGNVLSPAVPSQGLSDSWSEVTWRFSLDYRATEDTLVYGSISKGF
jgi:iron complex outermembrane receptor protein